jgi:hypothetical protein
MKRLSALVEWLRGSRRPPTGPLTATEQTAPEQTAVQESRPQTQSQADERAEQEQAG